MEFPFLYAKLSFSVERSQREKLGGWLGGVHGVDHNGIDVVILAVPVDVTVIISVVI